MHPISLIFLVLYLLGISGMFSIVSGDEDMVTRSAGVDPFNAGYKIEGQWIKLENGRFEEVSAPGSATKVKIAFFGDPEYGNLDKDSDKDAVVILTFDPGGSGTFYYAAAALKKNGRYIGTNAVLLGDRVLLKNITIRNRVIIANFADRHPSEPMAKGPSSWQSVYLMVKDGQLAKLTLKPGKTKVLKNCDNACYSLQPCKERGENNK